MNLNLKKGLTRLFLIGLIVSTIIGFFKVDSDQLTNTNRFYFDSIASIEKEIKDPRCLALLKANNQSTDPVLLKYQGSCYHIGLFWDEVEDKRKSKDQEVTGQFLIDVVDEQRRIQHLQYILVNTGFYVAGYLLICLVAWLVFISVRWIKRGFTS